MPVELGLLQTHAQGIITEVFSAFDEAGQPVNVWTAAAALVADSVTTMTLPSGVITASRTSISRAEWAGR